MIANATYDSLESIPETFEGNLRDEFHQVGGKWVLKDSALPGVAQVFHSAIYANEQRAVDQAKRHKKRADELEIKVKDLSDQVVSDPGAVVLSPDDAKLWETYSKLGTPKDLEAKIGELSTLREKVETHELTTAVSGLAQEFGFNSDVLADWAVSSQNLQFVTKEVEGKKLPFVRVEEADDKGKVTVSEKQLDVYAKETLPEWKYNALMTGAKTTEPRTTGVRLPNVGSAQNGTSLPEAKKAVDVFNAERAAKPNPFMTTDVKK